MLKWISSLLGGSALEVPADVPKEWAQSLEKVLEPVNAAQGGSQGSAGRRGLGRDILSYVLRGEPESVLAEVSLRPEVASHIAEADRRGGRAQSALPDVFEHLSNVPVAVVLRLAKVLEASGRAHSYAFRMQLPRGVLWPEALLLASAGLHATAWLNQKVNFRGLSYAQLEALLEAEGLPPSALLVAGLATSIDGHYGTDQRLKILCELPDYPEALERHLQAVRPHLLAGSAAQRVHVLNMLGKAKASSLDSLAPELCELAVGSSKQVRIQAENHLRRCGPQSCGPLRELARKGKPEQRMLALRLLHELGQSRHLPEEVDFALQMAAADKAPSVQALLGEWQAQEAAQQEAQAAPAQLQVQMPQLDWSAANCQIPSAALAAFWQQIADSIEAQNATAREHHQRMAAQGHRFTLRQDEFYKASDHQALAHYLASGQARAPDKRPAYSSREWAHVSQAAVKLAQAEGVSPEALFKVLLFFDIAVAADGSLMNPAIQVVNSLHQRLGRPTLLELSCMLDEAGKSGLALLRNYCYTWGVPLASDWPPEHVWPFVAHHLEAVVQALLHNTFKDYSFGRAGLFRALATLPQPPQEAINALFTLALGSGKSERQSAQEALQNQPGKEERIITALSDGKAETRTVAAQWLGRLRHLPAVPALEKAVAKEKHDVAKGAMLDALQLLGQPVERYLDRKALAAESAKSLAKGLPKELEDFPWNAVPPVHWADGGGGELPAEVPSEVLRWMIVQAAKQKSPEPNAVLRKYCEMFEARDREAFGQFVLETWLREDVRPIAADEAMRLAKSQAQSTHSSMASYPQYFKESPHWGKTEEELTAFFLPLQMRQPAGSAIGSKGVLAVAAACAAERAAAPVQRYLKEWYGTRAAQGKALISMLAWIEHPSATQLMLAIGSRFRTKSFQEEATRQAQALAERKGWTLAELADRTVPSAGLDETGTLELSYGQRSFTARLLPDFKLELFNPEGKKISALPEPRQDDDADLAKDSKKALSAARKEIKSIVDLQTDRLYEALCTERDWPAADWSAYLQQHPVLRHLVQRLVWMELGESGTYRMFRPMDDGSLTDVEDNALELAEGSRVRLAHDCVLSAEEVAAWQQHLLDYDIQPLFQQLGKGRYLLPEAQSKADIIKDFEGHLIEAFALRGRALKLGYTRGPAEDGGWFHVYEKRFPTLGVQAVIEFTGNPLPEENRTVALLSLTFAASGESSSWQRSRLALAQVPKILLSECYNDLRLIAADGSGYHDDWRKQSQY